MWNVLDQSFSDGSIIDVIFVFVAIECAALLWLRSYTFSLKVTDIILLFLPGVFLLQALRAALESERWPIIAMWLTAALLAHLGDLVMRIRKRAT